MNLEDFKKRRSISKETELKVLKDLGFQLGRVIEHTRTIKGQTQVELAKKINSTQSVIARIENGNKLPSLTFLKRIADAFDTYLLPPKFGFMEETKTAVQTVIWVMQSDSEPQTARTLPKYETLTAVNSHEYEATY